MAIGYLLTAAETSTGATPVNYGYSDNPIDVRRYGVVAGNPAAAGANTTALRTLLDPTKVGPTGKVIFPNISGADVYYFSGVIPIRDGIHIDLMGSTINFTGTGTAADNNSGLFFALRDFSCENGTLLVNWATGASTSSGNAIQIGARGSDSSYFTVYDSLLSSPMGNVSLKDLKINSVVTGAGLASAGCIALTGGLWNVSIENVSCNGNNTLTQAITYEFGWATNPAVLSTRQTSHAHNISIRNVTIQNLDLNTGIGVIMGGAYSVAIDGLHVTNASSICSFTPGESLFFRPWSPYDLTGAKHNVNLRNIAGQGIKNIAIGVAGSQSATGGYLGAAWAPSTAYVVGQTVSNQATWHTTTAYVAGNIVKNGANRYVCVVPGTSAGAGGPTGTGNGIVDGSVTWNYATNSNFYVCTVAGTSASSGGPTTIANGIVDGGVTWNNVNWSQVDLYYFSLDGFSIDGAGTAWGIYNQGAWSDIRNGFIRNSARGIVVQDDSGKVVVDGVTILGMTEGGVSFDFSAPLIVPPRRKKVELRNCYIAGGSTSNVGGFAAVSLNNVNSAIIENNRFGYDAAFAGVAETTQGEAVFITGAASASNVICRANHVGGMVGAGNVAYHNVNNTPPGNGHTIQNATGITTFAGLWQSDFQSASAPGIATGATITTNGLKVTRVAPSAAVTGIILESGSAAGQISTVVNESVAANTVTFAAVGVSHVADGVSCVIPGLKSATFVWDSVTSAWYHSV